MTRAAALKAWKTRRKRKVIKYPYKGCRAKIRPEKFVKKCRRCLKQKPNLLYDRKWGVLCSSCKKEVARHR